MLKIREYQQSVIDDIVKSALSGHKRILVQAPCGSGKTIIASQIIQHAISRGQKIVFVAHRRELVHQTQEKLASIGIDCGIIMADYPNDNTLPVQVCSVQSLHRQGVRSRRIIMPPADLVILDESHHLSSSKTWQDILLCYPNTFILGLTATPINRKGQGMAAYFDDMVRCPTINELTSMGYLVPVKYYAPSIPDLAGVKIQAGDYNEAQLEKKMDVPKLIGDICENWTRIAGGRKTIVFATSVKHSIHITESFRRLGILAEHIDGNTPDKERDKKVNDFKKGNIQVLSNCAIFNEGFDVPQASCLVFARPTKSLSLYLQVAGRVLRPAEGKQDCCIAEGELVLTNKGLVPIEKITDNHRLWDGDSWVTHGGIIYKGIKEVIKYDGLTATPDHKVRTQMGWKTFGECSTERTPIVKTGVGREEIRISANCFSHCQVCGGMENSNSDGQMYSMQKSKVGILQQSKTREYKGLSGMRSAEAISVLDISQINASQAEMRKPKARFVERIRRQGDKIQLQICYRSNTMGTKESRTKKRINTGQNQQQRPLRTGKSVLVNKPTELFSYKKNKSIQNEYGCLQAKASESEICGFNSKKIINHNDGKRNINKMENSIFKTKRKVWDILNAGPKNRFTVSGLLVHNCIIDHSGAVYEHGLINEDRDWKLEYNEGTINKERSVRIRQIPKPITCSKCHCVYERRLTCPECGNIPTVRGKEVATYQAYLEELTECDKGLGVAKEKWYPALFTFAKSKNFNLGWAAHKFREKWGIWPRGKFKQEAIVEIPLEIQAWINKTQRAYYNRKQHEKAQPEGGQEGANNQVQRIYQETGQDNIQRSMSFLPS